MAMTHNEASVRLAAELLATYPGGNPGTNLKSIPHRFHLREVAFE